MHYFKADVIYPVSSAPIVNGLVITNDEGKILQLLNEEESKSIASSLVKQYHGIIAPGFVNTHCHLELSHLHGKMPEKKGLIGFIQQLQKIRNQSIEIIEEATFEWQQKMYDEGIVAVGDICNGTNTLKAKQKGLLHYHNFIELFSFNPNKANESLQHGKVLLDQFNQIKQVKKFFTSSMSPHAPYSTSLELIKLIAANTENNKHPLFIHNQESREEILMYLNNEGGFIEMLNSFGIDTSHWKKQPQGSMITVASLFKKDTKMLWVHNTFSTQIELKKVLELMPNSYFCLCPNANLFIENTLPDFNLFLNYHDQICIGTDSLASNHQLSILSEIQTIQKHSKINFATLLQWSTLNGARALGFDQELGSIEIGKTPGLNLIEVNNKNGLLSEISRVSKII